MIRRTGLGTTERMASRLRDRITIEQPLEVPDAQGGMVRSWQVLVQCFAEITPLSQGATERPEAGKVAMRANYRIVTRARSDVSVRMRILWQSHVLNIRSVVAVDGRLEIMAEEGVAV